MIKPENIKKYILPLTLIIVLSIMMVMGIVYIRSYMNQKAAAERAAQLEQISSQIKVNLEYGLDNQWSLVDSIIHYCEGKKFDGKDDVRKEIG